MKLPADCVLIAGQVTVNEAMLTGEATVVSKQPTAAGCAPNAAEPRNTLFGGSIVVQLRVKAEVASAGVLAVVVRTGFDSVKGRLVLSILYPQPGERELVPTSHPCCVCTHFAHTAFVAAHFEFMRQALVFLLLLAILAVVGFAVNVKALIDACASVGKIILRGCDMASFRSGLSRACSGQCVAFSCRAGNCCRAPLSSPRTDSRHSICSHCTAS